MKSFAFTLIIVFQGFLVYSQHRAEIHCKHFYKGYPFGTPKTNDLIIRDIYALSNNDDTKLADWVCYRLDREIISGTSKTRNWAPDPWLDENESFEPYPDHGDYRDANATLQVDRGHQAPLASFDGSPYWYETNYFSNITPQKSNLNQGPWATLEGRVRNMVELYDEIYVMTGTLYERDMPALPRADEEHKIPSGYWKIIIYESPNGYVNASSFIFDQETPRNDKMIDHLVTIDEIEEKSGLDFLWMLESYKETAIEKNKNEEWAEEHFKD